MGWSRLPSSTTRLRVSHQRSKFPQTGHYKVWRVLGLADV
jgi:hypothetical protein